MTSIYACIAGQFLSLHDLNIRFVVLRYRAMGRRPPPEAARAHAPFPVSYWRVPGGDRASAEAVLALIYEMMCIPRGLLASHLTVRCRRGSPTSTCPCHVNPIRSLRNRVQFRHRAPAPTNECQPHPLTSERQRIQVRIQMRNSRGLKIWGGSCGLFRGGKGGGTILTFRSPKSSAFLSANGLVMTTAECFATAASIASSSLSASG